MSNITYRDKILPRKKLVLLVKMLREVGKKIVMTGGMYDLLHPGHTRFLEEAKKQGDILIVALNSDTSTRRNKGPHRPIQKQQFRAEVIAALASVDYVTFFSELTPEKIIREIQPDIWAKGIEYKNKFMPEAKVVTSYGGQI